MDLEAGQAVMDVEMTDLSDKTAYETLDQTVEQLLNELDQRVGQIMAYGFNTTDICIDISKSGEQIVLFKGFEPISAKVSQTTQTDTEIDMLGIRLCVHRRDDTAPKAPAELWAYFKKKPADDWTKLRTFGTNGSDGVVAKCVKHDNSNAAHLLVITDQMAAAALQYTRTGTAQELLTVQNKVGSCIEELKRTVDGMADSKRSERVTEHWNRWQSLAKQMDGVHQMMDCCLRCAGCVPAQVVDKYLSNRPTPVPQTFDSLRDCRPTKMCAR